MKEKGDIMNGRQTAMSMDIASIAAERKTEFMADYDIAQAIAEGDRARFKEIYDQNIPILFNLARRLADTAAEAEDIVQDAFVRAYQKIHLFAGRSTLSSWLYRICLNVGLEHLRRKKGTFSSDDMQDTSLAAVEPDQKSLILRRKLEKAIKQLPDGCRTVFILHDIEGFNHKEIAAQLNLAEGTSKSQLFKARAMLRKILTGREL
jgi:RNA polymerase sigma-70 factor (ECF subfamily)